MIKQQSLKEQKLGDLLRYWRQKRGKSQLDLSIDTGISQRHLSFVESGRSVPSRDLLSTIAEALNIPLRERNALMLSTGYAPLYHEYVWADREMTVITQALDRVLSQHEPHPALILDRYWNVIRTNEAAPRFFGSFINLELHQKPRNLLHLMFGPLRPFIEDWEQVATGLLQRVRRESLGYVIDEKTMALLDELHQYPGVKQLPMVPTMQSPILPITFRKGKKRFSYFSLITTVGTPQCVTAQELRIECMFPVDVS